jgi:PPOX class probable F420-dependent enzyme
MTEITPEVRAFLAEGTRTGKVGYLAADGRPLVAPIWFVLDGDDLVFNTGGTTAKARAIARDPRLVLCVDLQEPPFAFVQVQGEATVSTDPDELVRTATAIGGRYMGADRAEEFGKRNGVPGELVVRLRPTRIIAQLDMTG